MQITSAFAAPTLVKLGEFQIWVQPFRLADFAMLASWLDDTIPGYDERDFPPSLSEEEPWEKLMHGEGAIYFAYAGLRHNNLSLSDVTQLIVNASDDERTRLVSVLLGRRRLRRVESDGQSITQLFWGPPTAALCEKYHMTPEQIGDLTLDQFDMLAMDGCESERPAGTGPIQVEEVMRMWADARAKWKADHPEETSYAPT